MRPSFSQKLNLALLATLNGYFSNLAAGGEGGAGRAGGAGASGAAGGAGAAVAAGAAGGAGATGSAGAAGACGRLSRRRRRRMALEMKLVARAQRGSRALTRRGVHICVRSPGGKGDR